MNSQKRVNLDLVEDQMTGFQIGKFHFDSEQHEVKLDKETKNLTKKVLLFQGLAMQATDSMAPSANFVT